MSGAASGGDPVAFALGMTGCNKRELLQQQHHQQHCTVQCCDNTLYDCIRRAAVKPASMPLTLHCCELQQRCVICNGKVKFHQLQADEVFCCTAALLAAAFQALATQFDWSRYKTLGDFGGSAGVLCCCVAAAQPHMTCTTHDLPAVHDAAAQYVQQQGLTDKVQVSYSRLSACKCHWFL
jgi:hypothetical protein